jgi:CBS domain-containing protein
MPYLIESIVNQQKNLVTVEEDDKVTNALDRMIGYDYSQLPVVDKEGQLTGIVTYQSIIQGARSFDAKPDELHVRDVIQTNIRSFDVEDNLFDLLDEIKRNNAVVIVTPGGLPIGIITSYDAAEFLRMHSEGMMRVEGIEGIIQNLILACYSDDIGQVDVVRLNQAIQSVIEHRLEQGNKKPIGFKKLTLNEYISLLVMKSTWGFFEPILGVKREQLSALLIKVRDMRNDLAHFRKEIEPRDRDELIYCATWLESRYAKFEASRKQAKIQAMIEEYQAEHAAVEDEAPKRKTRQSVYAALANWLRDQTDNEVDLTFEQIEGIIKRPLPLSALELRAWWANDTVGHTHSVLWLNAGWRVETVNLQERRVRFVRV